MSLAAKLQLREAMKVRVLHAPKGLDLGDLPVSKAASAEAVVLFVADQAGLRKHGKPAFDAARQDKLAWIAYPKDGQLGTGLNRDVLWKLVEPEAVRPVRQVSIDATWSALRFRPA